MNPEPHVNLAEPNGTIRDIKNDKIKKKLAEIKKIIKEEEGIGIKTLLIIVD